MYSFQKYLKTFRALTGCSEGTSAIGALRTRVEERRNGQGNEHRRDEKAQSGDQPIIEEDVSRTD
jgi:hypothetical protein